MITLRVYKAEPREDRTTSGGAGFDMYAADGFIIEIIEPLPLPASNERLDRIYKFDAEHLAQALFDHLPIGTLHQLIRSLNHRLT